MFQDISALEWEWAKSLQGDKKILWSFRMGTFRKLLFITSSRRLEVRVSKAINLERLF